MKLIVSSAKWLFFSTCHVICVFSPYQELWAVILWRGQGLESGLKAPKLWGLWTPHRQRLCWPKASMNWVSNTLEKTAFKSLFQICLPIKGELNLLVFKFMLFSLHKWSGFWIFPLLATGNCLQLCYFYIIFDFFFCLTGLPAVQKIQKLPQKV